MLRLQMGNFTPWSQLLKQQSLMEAILDYQLHEVKHFLMKGIMFIISKCIVSSWIYLLTLLFAKTTDIFST